jgi:hypothetical protein
MELLHETGGETHSPPSMEPHIDGIPTYNGVQPGSTRETLVMMVMHSQHENTYINEWDI